MMTLVLGAPKTLTVLRLIPLEPSLGRGSLLAGGIDMDVMNMGLTVPPPPPAAAEGKMKGIMPGRMVKLPGLMIACWPAWCMMMGWAKVGNVAGAGDVVITATEDVGLVEGGAFVVDGAALLVATLGAGFVLIAGGGRGTSTPWSTSSDDSTSSPSSSSSSSPSPPVTCSSPSSATAGQTTTSSLVSTTTSSPATTSATTSPGSTLIE